MNYYLQPGRVVTLLSSNDSNDQVWGVAYKISPQDIDKVVKHLDYREKGGYERKSVIFYPSHPIKPVGTHSFSNGATPSDLQSSNMFQTRCENAPFCITIYIGNENNPNYAGVEDIGTIAKHILVSHGPSGPNTEYLYKLASAMRLVAPGIQDEHLFTLEATVKALEQEHDKSKKLDRDLDTN